MTFSPENGLFLGAFLIFLSIIISKTGFRFGIPTLLIFLFVGMLFGSDGLGLQFDSAKDAQFIGMISLSVILFTGGMDTKFKDIRPILAPGIILSTLAVVLTTLIMGGFIYLLGQMTWIAHPFRISVALLLAATMSSTDSASVFNLLRSQNIGLRHRLKPLLEFESGSNDPMAYMLTIVFMQIAISGGDPDIWALLGNIAQQFSLGLLLGWAGGRASAWLINRINLPNASLYPVLLLALCFIIFTVTDAIKGNAYLAVYVAGLVLGNRQLSYRREMTNFMEGMTWLVQIIMFLSLGLLVNPRELWEVIPMAISISFFMMFAARPLSVHLTLSCFRKIPLNAKHLLSWVGLRGAVPILFATYPLLHGVEDARLIFNIVFVTTLLSLTLQGMSISSIAQRLELAYTPSKKRNEFGIELPETLNSYLHELVITAAHLRSGNHLSDLSFPEETLVMIVKRGSSVIIPNGKLELQIGDILLTISRHDSASFVNCEGVSVGKKTAEKI